MDAPYDQKRPERGRYEIGKAGKDVEKGPGDHELSFRDGQESFPYEGTEDQWGDAENPDKKTNLPLFGSESHKIDRNGWDQNAEYRWESKLGKEIEEEVTAYYFWACHVLFSGWRFE